MTTVVIGAGIIGTAIAHDLQKRGRQVLLVDRDGPGRGASFGNMASIAVTEFMPASRPSVWRQIPGWMLDPEGPVRVRPSYMPKLVPWFLRFIAASRPAKLRELEAQGAALCGRALEDTMALLRETGLEREISEEGCLSLYADEAEFRADRAHIALLERFGFPHEVIGRQAIRALEPELSDRIGLAVLFPQNRSMKDPYRLVLALEPGHAHHSARYEAALRERNRLLADEREPDPAWLDGVERHLARHGSQIAQARARTVAAVAEELAALPAEPFALPLIALERGGPADEAELAAALGGGRRRDRQAGRTLTGPHRDELVVTMAGKNMPAADCSTGEQKAMLIALTLAHAGLAARGRPGVLLLDEVAAHLDPVRRAALFERLRPGAAQVWMTGTELAPFEEIRGEAAVWMVEGGAVSSA